jgi:hypothetical protein
MKSPTYKLRDGREAIITQYFTSKGVSGKIVPEAFTGYTLPDYSTLDDNLKQELIDLYGNQLILGLMAATFEPTSMEIDIARGVRRNRDS